MLQILLLTMITIILDSTVDCGFGCGNSVQMLIDTLTFKFPTPVKLDEHCRNNVIEFFSGIGGGSGTEWQYMSREISQLFGTTKKRSQTCTLPDGSSKRYECLPGLPDPMCDVEVDLYLYEHATKKKNFRLFNRTTSYREQINRERKFFNNVMGHIVSVVVVIHGFIEDEHPPWMMDLLNALFKWQGRNVLLVKWESPNTVKNLVDYLGSVADTRLVADIVAMFLKTLIDEHLLEPQNVHLVGHSLGAHIAGFIGKQINGIGGIIGLDPAGVYFDCIRGLGLDHQSAKWVQVLHTDSKSNIRMGTYKDRGHYDYYVNYGTDIQPGCSFSEQMSSGKIKEAMKDFRKFGCSHLLAIKILLQAVQGNGCEFMAIPLNQSKPEMPIFTKDTFSTSGMPDVQKKYYGRPLEIPLGIIRYNVETTANENDLCPAKYRTTTQATTPYSRRTRELEIIVNRTTKGASQASKSTSGCITKAKQTRKQKS